MIKSIVPTNQFICAALITYLSKSEYAVYGTTEAVMVLTLVVRKYVSKLTSSPKSISKVFLGFLLRGSLSGRWSTIEDEVHENRQTDRQLLLCTHSAGEDDHYPPNASNTNMSLMCVHYAKRWTAAGWDYINSHHNKQRAKTCFLLQRYCIRLPASKYRDT